VPLKHREVEVGEGTFCSKRGAGAQHPPHGGLRHFSTGGRRPGAGKGTFCSKGTQERRARIGGRGARGAGPAPASQPGRRARTRTPGPGSAAGGPAPIGYYWPANNWRY
jgi:hypothetical protein